MTCKHVRMLACMHARTTGLPKRVLCTDLTQHPFYTCAGVDGIHQQLQKSYLQAACMRERFLPCRTARERSLPCRTARVNPVPPVSLAQHCTMRACTSQDAQSATAVQLLILLPVRLFQQCTVPDSIAPYSASAATFRKLTIRM